MQDFTRRSVGISKAPGALHALPGSSLPVAEAVAAPLCLGRGTMVGRFSLEDSVGQGGMAAVFAAKDTLLGRRVALKVLLQPTDSVDMNAGLRFLREAEALASMDHPNIVRIYDAGMTEQATYLVLELLEGESLVARLKRKRRLLHQEALDVMLPVMDAVDHAHSRGVLHLDLKPSNVLLQARDNQGAFVPKVLDFGVCSLSEVDDDLDPTREDHAGTPAYMAPETLSGLSPTAAADIFSLAVLTYECLTGINPFAKQTSLLELKRSIVERRYPPLKTLFPYCTDALNDVVSRAMSPKPSERPPTTTPLADALRGLGSTEERTDEPQSAVRSSLRA